MFLWIACNPDIFQCIMMWWLERIYFIWKFITGWGHQRRCERRSIDTERIYRETNGRNPAGAHYFGRQCTEVEQHDDYGCGREHGLGKILWLYNSKHTNLSCTFDTQRAALTSSNASHGVPARKNAKIKTALSSHSPCRTWAFVVRSTIMLSIARLHRSPSIISASAAVSASSCPTIIDCPMVFQAHWIPMAYLCWYTIRTSSPARRVARFCSNRDVRI